MNVPLEELSAADKHVPMRDLVARLQQTLERNHQKILAAALSDWEQKYAGRDPSDACASVHIAPAPKRTRKPASSFQKLVRRSRNTGRRSPGRD
jgi:inorganic triphosphatase YgiF